MSSLKAIVREFIKELIELQNEPSNEESIHNLERIFDEFEDKSKSITMYMRMIMSYVYSRRDYVKAIQELNKLIEE